MKSKCSFILKASLSLVLALLMLFGTMATSIAAAIENAPAADAADAEEPESQGDEGFFTAVRRHTVDLAETGYSFASGARVYFDDTNTNWGSAYLVINYDNDTAWYEWKTMTNITGTKIYYYNFTASASNVHRYYFTKASNTNGNNRAPSSNYAGPFGWDFSDKYAYFKPNANNSATVNGQYDGTNTIDGRSDYKADLLAKVAISDNNGSSYTAQTSGTKGGKVTVKATYWTSGTAINSTTPSNSNTSYTSITYQNAVVTGLATWEYSSLSDDYEFVKWATTVGGSAVNDTTNWRVTGTRTLYAHFRKKPLITLSDTSGTVLFGSDTVTGSKRVSHGIDTTVKITAPTGYIISSVSGANWSATDTTSNTYWEGSINATSNQTLTITYAEILDSSIALTAFTNGSASTDGGTIKVGGSDVSSIPVGNVGVDTTVTALEAESSSEYAFTGWMFDGSNLSHIKYSFDNSTWNTPANNSTIYGDDQSTIYIRTDGTSGLTTADAIVKAMFVSNRRTVTTAALLATDDTGYKSTNSFTTNPSLTGAGTYNAVSSPGAVSLVADEPVGYKFIGWYVSNNASLSTLALDTAVQGTSGIYTYTAGTKTLSFTMNTTCELHYYALYKKIYYLTAYNSYTEPQPNKFVFRTSPPRTITATNAQGTTTFTYATSNNPADRGETDYGDGDGTQSDVLDPGTANIKTSGTYYEGNKIAVLAGDVVVMTYSTLSSSDVIRGVFFNNDIRYTTELEIDNLYTGRRYQGYHTEGEGEDAEDVGNGTDDSWNYTYLPATTLFADVDYYDNTERIWQEGDTTEPTGALINTVIPGKTYAATVDQNAHTVTWTVNQDYLNIDVELGAMKQIVFSDRTNAKVTSLWTDDYYTVGENISTGETPATRLAVYAKGNTNQKNIITKNDVKLYYYNSTKGKFTDATGAVLADQTQPVELADPDNTIEVNITTGDSIDNGDYSATDSSEYIYFTGTMPNTDVYIDLNIDMRVKMYIGSKVIADAFGSKSYLAQVATVKAEYTSPSSTNHTAPNNAINNATAIECTKGSEVKYTVTWGTDSGSGKTWDHFYMFNGWYRGNASGPYLDQKPISTGDTLYYYPKASEYIYAVGTRDVFINGSKYITGADAHWNSTDGFKNFRMEFDPSYSEERGGVTYWGRYSWTITDAMFDPGAGGAFTYTNHANPGNGFFQFYDEESGNNQTLWHDHIGKNWSSYSHGVDFGCENNGNDSYGYLIFNKTDDRYQGYSSPITIYYYPGSNFSVDATPIWPHIFVSNGYKNMDEANPNNHAVTLKVDGADSNYQTGSRAWTTLTNEGTVQEYYITKKNATVTFSKETASSNFIVSNFFVYNISTNKVQAYPATNTSGNIYTADVKMNNDEQLYVVPIIEDKDADMTIVFDASQMDYSQWGKFISCYGWYNGTNSLRPYGNYPGQLMIPYDGGKTWKANFKSTARNGNASNTIAGITFANYLDGSNTWLGGYYNNDANTRVIGTVSNEGSQSISTSGGIIQTYNIMKDTDNGAGTYNKANFKAQTYDYREPIAYYENKGEADEILLTFSVKDGDDTTLMTWSNYDLKNSNMKDYIPGGTYYNTYPLSFEYLKAPNGKYTDLNGYAFDDKPTPSFYICAKGMATYKSNELKYLFWTKNRYEYQGGYSSDRQETNKGWTNRMDYPDGTLDGGGIVGDPSVSMNYAVEWYVYDAAGNFITNVCSAGFADKSKDEPNNTLIAQRLMSMGYAVEGRSVAVCYDTPRYCYNTKDDVTPNIPNGGNNFDAYRFSGQWLQLSEYDTCKVYTGVGMLTDNGEILEKTNSKPYGRATINLDTSKLKHIGENLSGTGVDDESGLPYAMLTIKDGDRKAVTLSASSTNFAGWYYWDEDYEELKFASSEINYTPGISKEITYYAMYEANATYSYQYTGRQGAANEKSYASPGGRLTNEELNNRNIISKSDDRKTDIANASKMPGEEAVSIFKKKLTWSTTISDGILDNLTEYVMKVYNATITDETFTLTAFYPNSVGGDNVAHDYDATIGGSLTTDIPYNTVIDMTEYIARKTEIAGMSVASYAATTPTRLVFQGWYETNNTGSTRGRLLSTQANFGQVIVKNTYIKAVYGDASLVSDDTYEIYIDDQVVTREMYSETSGTFYNDSIVCLRKNNKTLTTLGENWRVGVIVVDDGGKGSSINPANLPKYAKALDEFSGKTGTSGGRTVTNVFTTTVTNFGRTDLAVKYDYAKVAGHTYYVYAYYYDGTNYHFNTTNVPSATYGAYTRPSAD